MPIMDPQDAAEVEEQFKVIFAADLSRRADELRKLFVEILDFERASGFVSLANAPASVNLPESAERLAAMSGVTAVYVALDIPDSDRVRKAEATEAAKLVSDELAGDLLLVMTNSSNSQIHFIYPSFEGTAPALRRMVVERDLPRRTAVQQLSNIYWNWKDTDDIRGALEKVYDVESVTTLFFSEYKRVFDVAMEKVQGFGPGEEEEEAKRLFVQTLFNRLMFVYFLSRKGWLTFNGDKDYLNALWRGYTGGTEEKNFYDARLSALFFAGLNNPQSMDLSRNNPTIHSQIGDIPFLNGGLFDKSELDNRSGLMVPDEAIAMILRELFEKFNFTVMESTPLDVEIAVDPEMLGKVFEELVTGRHESGSYYTPRPVVAFMCREALKGYLEVKDTGATAEAIRSFVDDRDSSVLSMSSAPRVALALAEVRVVDPACGSGAYLLGMLQELVDLQEVLYSDQLAHHAKDIYALKLRIIEHSLYGADIDEFARNIAMLRLWLSLAIEYDGPVADLKPLPNLDFKIVCGDSLSGPDPSPDNYGDLFRHRVEELADQLAGFKRDHMSSTGQQKFSLAAEIETLLDNLRDAFGESAAPNDAVDWRIEFAEVFARNGGFDIAIANPPYVRQEDIGGDKAELRQLYSQAVTGMSDLYCYFYARGVQLLRESGMHVFVCSNSWLDVGYGAKLQEYLLKNTWIKAIYDSAVERQFSTAAINTIISVIKKSLTNADESTRFISLKATFDLALADQSLRRELIVTKKELYERGSGTESNAAVGTRYVGDKWGGKYLRAPDVFFDLLKICGDKLVPLSQVATVKAGCYSGINDFFYIDYQDVEDWGIEGEYLTPLLRSSQQVTNLNIDQSLNTFVLNCQVTKEELIRRGHKGVLNYIQWGEDQVTRTRQKTKAGIPWPETETVRRRRPGWWTIPSSNLTQTRNFMLYVINERFICPFSQVPLTSDRCFHRLFPKAGVDENLLFAVLNSTLAYFFVSTLGRTNLGLGAMKFEAVDAGKLLVINPSALQNPIDVIECISPIANRAALKVAEELRQEDRKVFDATLFDALGIPDTILDALYGELTNQVGSRISRARTFA